MTNLQQSQIFILSKQFVCDYAKLKPYIGTAIGVYDYDNVWGDLSMSNVLNELDLIEKYKTKLDTEVKPTGDEWHDYAIFALYDILKKMTLDIKNHAYYYDLNTLDCTFHTLISTLIDTMKTDSVTDWQNILSRLDKFDLAFVQYSQRLYQGVTSNYKIARRQIMAVISQTQDLITSFGKELIAKVPQQFNKELIDKINNAKLKTLTNFLLFLQTKYLPLATDNDAVGHDRYVHYAKSYLGKDIDLLQTYNDGFANILTLQEEIKRVSHEINPNLDLISVRQLAENNETAPNITEFIKLMQNVQNDAIQKLEPYFNIPPEAKIIEIKESPFDRLNTYYYPPTDNFTRRGIIFYKKEANKPIPIMNEISTAYHEGFPGHHLQLSIQVANKDKLSDISRLMTNYSGYPEGWALYVEYFMYEMNFYSKPEYVLGMLYNSMMRACRIVIDIGLHLELKIPDNFYFNSGKKWNYDLGVNMLTSIAGLSVNYAKAEMTRYCGIPGQAISYKIGEQIIRNLREKYMNNVPNAKLKDFHQLILSKGCQPLRKLETDINHAINKLK